jgi:hypothetical protein
MKRIEWRRNRFGSTSFVAVASAFALIALGASSSHAAGLLFSTTGCLFEVPTDTTPATPTTSISSLNVPRGLALDREDKLYLKNCGQYQIRRFGPTGALIELDYVFVIVPSSGGRRINFAVPEPSTNALGGIAGITARRMRSRSG